MLISNQFVYAESEYRREQLKKLHPGRARKSEEKASKGDSRLGAKLLKTRRAWST